MPSFSQRMGSVAATCAKVSSAERELWNTRRGSPRMTSSGSSWRTFEALISPRNVGPNPMNTWVAGHSVDACWPDYGLVVELDSRTWHETRAAFQRDRERDRALQLAGLRCIRFTSTDLEDAGDVARTVTGLLVMGGYRP